MRDQIMGGRHDRACPKSIKLSRQILPYLALAHLCAQLTNDGERPSKWSKPPADHTDNVTAKAQPNCPQHPNVAPIPTNPRPQNPRQNSTFDEFPIAFSSTPEIRSLEAFVRQEASETLHKVGRLVRSQKGF